MKNDNKDKRLAKIILFTLVVFLGYLLYVFIPMWAFSLSKSNGEAKIISVSNNTIVYKYFNNYKQKTIELRRKSNKKIYIDRIRKYDTVKIKYSKIFPGYVVFTGIDKRTPIYLTVITVCLTLTAIWLYILVLKDKLSLRSLLGMK